MKFGTFVPQGWKHDLEGVPEADQWELILATANTIEDAGYDSIWVYDHFHSHPVVAQTSTFEAWSLMAALAAVTSRVRLGQMCTCVGYRPPSLLAKQAVSIDAISGGRLDVGIGAGWSEGEYRAYGYDFPRAGVRLDMLEEAVQVMRAMWTQDEAHFSGDHYTLDGAITRPKPIQRPHPPLWIAGGGEKRTLRIVATYGDYANFSGDIDQFAHKSRILEQHCDAVGRPYAEINRSAHRMAVVGRNDAEVAERVAIAAARRNSAPEKFAASHITGTVGEVTELMAAYREAGCSDMILYFYDMGRADSLELFAAQVMPQL